MIIDEDYISTLKRDDGESVQFSFPRNEVNALDRMQGTISVLKKHGVTNVIHVGCCNHPNYIEEMVKTGQHLQVLLSESFSNVLGFDINQEAYNKCKELGMTDIYCNDFNDKSVTQPIITGKFGDSTYTILIPEVIEHIPDVYGFLKSVKSNYSMTEGGGERNHIMITVPNAYSWFDNSLAFFHNKENINVDHKYTFTPITLMKLLLSVGIIPRELYFFSQSKITRMLKIPLTASTLAVYCDFENDE